MLITQQSLHALSSTENSRQMYGYMNMVQVNLKLKKLKTQSC